MSGKDRGSGWKSEFLDKLFGNKKRTILFSLAIAAAGYLLFLLFGDIHAADNALYRPVIMGIAAFGALCFVLGMQLINPFCSSNMMDFFELIFALCSGVGFLLWLLMFGIKLLFSNDACQAATIIAEIAGIWCALCIIHNMRK